METGIKNIDFSRLEYQEGRDFYFLRSKRIWQKKLSFQANRSLEILKPEAFSCFNNRPFILFFSDPVDKGRETALHRAIWNSQVPVAIIDRGNTVEIYNGLLLKRDKKSLELLAGGEDLNDFAYWEIQSGNTWNKYASLFKKERLDGYLLQNIEYAIQLLVHDGQRTGVNNNIANNLIGRVLFARYLIDRGVSIGDRFLNMADP